MAYPQDNPVKVRPMSDYYNPNPVFRAADMLTGGMLGAVTGDARRRREANEQRQIDLQAALQASAAESQSRARRRQAAIDLGINPEQFGDDDVALANEMFRRENMRSILGSTSKVAADTQAREAAQTEAKAKELGVSRARFTPMSDMAIPGGIGKVTEADETFFPRVTEADTALRKKRAESERTPQEQYEKIGPYVDPNGNFLGVGMKARFGPNQGQVGVVGADGTFKRFPDNAIQTVPSQQQRQIMPVTEFNKIRADLVDDEKSLRQFERYAQAQGGTDTGINRLANTFSSGFKTLFSSGKLSPEELAQRLADGQLQGLLGAARLSVVGGGVMTEQDAMRIIGRLGGDVNSLQNPEVVRQALSELYFDRWQNYQNNLLNHNFQVEQFYGSKGWKPWSAKDYSKVLDPQSQPMPSLVDPSQPQAAPANPADSILAKYGIK